MKKEIRNDRKVIDDKLVYIRGIDRQNNGIINYLEGLSNNVERTRGLDEARKENYIYYIEPVDVTGRYYIRCCEFDSPTATLITRLYKEVRLEDSMFVIKHKESLRMYTTDIFSSYEAAEKYLKERNYKRNNYNIIKLDFNYESILLSEKTDKQLQSNG